MRGTGAAYISAMSSEGQTKSLWRKLFGDPEVPPKAEAPVPSATPTAEISVPVEQRKVLEEAIPFHRPADQSTTVGSTQFMFGALDDQPRSKEDAISKAPAPNVEPYRKKFKKYGRDVCLAGDSEPYDVLADNGDKLHHGVDGVSPL